MKKSDKEKSRIILFIIIALTIIIIVLINMLKNINKEEKKNENLSNINNSNIDMEYEEHNYHYEETELPNQEKIIEETKDIVYIQNMGEIFKIYNSNEPIVKVSVKIEDTIMNILNKPIRNKESLETFYNTNKEKIERRTYIKDYSEFQNLISKIFSNNSSKIVSSKIKDGSAKIISDNIIMAIIELTLDNDDVVLLTLEIDVITSEIKIS